MSKTYNPAQAHQAQVEYCNKNKLPHFAPGVGILYRCYRCQRNIYSEGGVTVEEAGNNLITGCPFCHWSFCE